MWRESKPRMTAEGRDEFPRRFIEAMYRAAPPEAIVLSWWSLSTPLWYGRWVEGKRPDLTIIDHRNLFDDGWDADFLKVAKAYVGKRPVITVYQDHDLVTLRRAGYILEDFSDPQFGHIGFYVTTPAASASATASLPVQMVGSASAAAPAAVPAVASASAAAQFSPAQGELRP